MVKSLKLTKSDWDISLDTCGNLAVIEGKGRVAQDVATAVRLFTGEAIFYVDKGIPYFEDLLGHRPPEQIMMAHMKKMAFTVPNVADAKPLLYTLKDRVLTGEIVIMDDIVNEAAKEKPPVENFYGLNDVYDTPNIYKAII